MNKGQLKKYLDRIAEGKSINWGVFLKLTEDLSFSESQLSQIFSWKKIKGGKYQVAIRDRLAFIRLKSTCELPLAKDRVTASLSGNSHRQAVSGSLLHLLGEGQNMPSTVVIDQNGDFHSELKLHHNLLVVENLENFLSLIKKREQASLWLGKAWQGDILFAYGNAVSNQLHRLFFAHYDNIQCLLDLDLGGFDIFKNIFMLYQEGRQIDGKEVNERCQFSLSAYYLEKYQQLGRPMTPQEYKQLIGRNYPESLRAVIDIVLNNQQFAEQEILLWD